MLVYGIFLVAISPPKSSTVDFFKGGFLNKTDDKKSTFLLASSAAISWIFAKSIYNAATLGGKYGAMGGLAYACYYTTFASVGLTAYRLRTRYGYGSLAEAINDNYGSGACVAYGLAVLFRLYQEIWSNSAVVASFYS
jgi:urea-proton symporter